MADIHIEIVSSSALDGKSSVDKIRLILDAIKKDKLLVLESPLTAQEEAALITATMALVGRDFPGIEVSRLGEESAGLRADLIKMLGGKTTGMSVVGPSRLVRQIKRNPGRLNVLARK